MNTTEGVPRAESTANLGEELPQKTVYSSPKQKRGKRSRLKKIYLLALLLLLIGAGCSVLSILGYQFSSTRIHQYYDLGQQAIQHLETARSFLTVYKKNPLDTHSIDQAQHEFTAALREFTSLNSNLESLPNMITYIPGYGILPPCAYTTRTWGGLVSRSMYKATLTHALDEDLNEGVAYVC